ncbi:probable G-protein coupled receptor 156 [Trichomycterus rosablanca]|uniref:probable G-protein coupled receptor 156 n=1 Tax=Trichomycterus rosablanca TaxID=2290929 RepID=UPI002F35072A
MEISPNCSADCDSGSCFIHPAVNNQQSRDVLLKLCTLSTRVVEVQSRSLSPVLCAVVWTLLSCGILLAFLFLIFTIRYKNNRIVKMSSPNLNILTLLGSVLTYTSGFLFAVEDRSPLLGTGARAVLQIRVWTLCIGSTLVFGPILGKTWRIYRVFTQRMPDRRVIIRDVQLMGLVALLVLVDVVVLAVWGLTDPVKCSRSVSAVVKVLEFDVRYTLSQLDSCSSYYTDLWFLLLSAVKASLMLYGTYLAGLTSNVSLPPVNQSLTIMAAVCLVSVSSAVVLPVCRYLYAWPNLVCGVMSGSIFVCTTTINCLMFVPQLTEWRQFEEELNPHAGQMAKYFSSPSRSMRSLYSEDEIYYLLGENNSMKRLISEKDAVIDSLQEQVNNAKDKLLKLMSVSHLQDEREMNSSTTNLNSSSTQTTVVAPEPSPSPLPIREEITLSVAFLPPHYKPPAAIPSSSSSASAYETPPEGLPPATPAPFSLLRASCTVLSPHSPDEVDRTSMKKLDSTYTLAAVNPSVDVPVDLHTNQGSVPLHPCLTSQTPGDGASSVEETAVPSLVRGCRQGFVSSKHLQEILHDLSVDAVSSSRRSPAGARRPSNPVHNDPAVKAVDSFSAVPPDSPPLQFYFPSISPYMMRKRRPPFNSCKNNSPPYYYPGSAPPGRRTNPKPTLTHSQPLGESHNKHDEGTEDQRWTEGSEARHDVQSRSRRRTRRNSCSGRRPISPSPRDGRVEKTGGVDSYGYSDSESSSSEDYCYYHRPYCEACRHSPSPSSSSETSDSEYEELCNPSHPVVNFKEDLKPTFV